MKFDGSWSEERIEWQNAQYRLTEKFDAV